MLLRPPSPVPSGPPPSVERSPLPHVETTRIDTAAGPFSSDRPVRPCGRFTAVARLRS